MRGREGWGTGRKTERQTEIDRQIHKETDSGRRGG